MSKKSQLNRWILASQFTLLLLVIALAWQGISAANTQERMVRALLSDYAQLIAENAERNFNGALGYRTLFTFLQNLQGQPENFPVDQPWSETVFADAGLDDSPGGYVLAVGYRNGSPGSTRLLYAATDVERLNQIQFLNGLATPKSGQNTRFLVTHPIYGQRVQMVVQIPQSNGEGELLIWFDPQLISEIVQAEMQTAQLLPPALGDPERIRPSIRLQLTDSAGQVIYTTTQLPDRVASRTHVLSGDYSGLMKSFSITTSIDPAIAGELVIGGLPYGKLPFIAGLVLIALLLAAVGFLLLQRQREVQRLRDDFVARVSHELRTPLTQIRMYAESMLLDRIQQADARQEALQVINREALRLGNMVDSILRFEEPGSGIPGPEPEAWSLKRWAEELNAEFQPLLRMDDALLNIEIPADATTHHNRDAIARIIGNLVDNSLKYGPSGQTIDLSYQKRAHGWSLFVTDQGPGVPVKQQDAIFEPYYRLDRDREAGTTGTGIGLSVARDLAISMGGTLTCDTGRKATFRLDMPDTTATKHGHRHG